MSEREQGSGPDQGKISPGNSPDHSDTDLARLLRLAGPRRDASPEVEERIKAQVKLAWQAKVAELADAERRRERRRIGLALAALLLVGVAAGVLLLARQGLSSDPSGPREGLEVAWVEHRIGEGSPGWPEIGDALLPGQELTTGASDRLALRLAGGQSLRLDVSSRLTLGSANRVRLGRGALYLDSGPGAAATVVETALGTVTDIGTQFQVRLGPEDLSVAVREGKALVRAGESRHEVPPGTFLRLAEDGSLERRETTGSDAVWAWVAAAATPFEIEGRSVHEVLTWVARERGQSLAYADPATAELAERTLASGSGRGLTPDELLELMLVSSGLGHRESGVGQLLITSGEEP